MKRVGQWKRPPKTLTCPHVYLHGCSSPVPLHGAVGGDELPQFPAAFADAHVVVVKHLGREHYMYRSRCVKPSPHPARIATIISHIIRNNSVV